MSADYSMLNKVAVESANMLKLYQYSMTFAVSVCVFCIRGGKSSTVQGQQCKCRLWHGIRCERQGQPD